MMFAILALLFCSTLASTLVASGIFAPDTYSITSTTMTPATGVVTFTPTVGKLYEVKVNIVGTLLTTPSNDYVFAFLEPFLYSGSGTYSYRTISGYTVIEAFTSFGIAVGAHSIPGTGSKPGFITAVFQFHVITSSNFVMGIHIVSGGTSTEYIIDRGEYTICELI